MNGGWTAWVGAMIFEVGSMLLLLEAVNEDRPGCFGWVLQHARRGAADDGDDHDSTSDRAGPAALTRVQASSLEPTPLTRP